MKSRLFFLCILGIGAIITIVLWINAQWLHPALRWHDIIPGTTIKEEVVGFLGRPDQIEERKDYSVYLYENPGKFDWDSVEIWFRKLDKKEIVNGIFLQHPTEYRSGEYRLDALVEDYGPPNMISWTTASDYRFLCWTKRGVGVLVKVSDFYGSQKEVNFSTFIINSTFLFEPMSRFQFDINKTTWPWPKVFVLTPNNMNTSKVTDSPDTLPLNPFGWWLLP